MIMKKYRFINYNGMRESHLDSMIEISQEEQNSDNPFDNFRNRAFPTMEIDLTFLLTLFNVENFSETFDIFIESTLQKNGPVEEGNIFNDIEYIDLSAQRPRFDRMQRCRSLTEPLRFRWCVSRSVILTHY